MSLNRREFLKTTGAATGFWITGRQLGFGQEKSPNAKLNIAFIGSGGRGGSHLGPCSQENIVALCDVNEAKIDEAAKKAPNAKRYVDFRKLFDEMGKSVDAFVVSTCEHTHAFAVLPAIQMDKHVYVEKPMTHGIWEARVLREAAAQHPNAVTQMGIQMHASDNSRRVVELIQSGAIGKVSEVHVWVHRSWGWQKNPQEAEANKDILTTQDRPGESSPIPTGLHWDLWLGPAPERPFNKIYFPGPRWYRWWEWGSGTMSDLGSHMNDLPFWALKLKTPLTIEGFGPPVHPDLAPANFHAAYEYGPRGDMPALKYHWYQGTERPPMYADVIASRKWGDGHLFIGDKGMLLSSHGKHVLLPEEKFKDFKKPEQTIANSPGAIQEWILASKGQGKTAANFDYSGPLTEANHLASIAYRMGKKLEWDPVAMKAKNCPEADRLIKREYRKGWELKA